MLRLFQRRFPVILIGLVALILALPTLPPAAAQDDPRLSRPGEYSGYSDPLYDGWQRASIYVTVRDGTRLAVDIFRPTLNGTLVTDPLPVIWTHHRYHRADVDESGRVRTLLDEIPQLAEMINYGYIIGVVDVRGGGASFGTRSGEFTREEALDAYDITEWFATQPWCSGNIGMFGLSYLGITQYMAASTRPPHLKAIFPMMAMFDMYSFVYPGGIFNENFVFNWGVRVIMLDKVAPTAPVDDDPDGVLLAQARAEHADNRNIYRLAIQQPLRDSQDPASGTQLFTEWNPSTYLDAINQSGVAIYTLGGWYDMYPRDATLWFNNLTVPQKLVITPWSHNGAGGFDLIAEHLRWFDYWLKGIDNGIMDEPPITYFVMGAPPGQQLRQASQWPLPQQQSTPYYLLAGPSGSVDSVNDGLLAPAAPTDPAGQDVYLVDYTTTTGPTNRWTDGYGGGFGYPDMAANDRRALTYTTPPLATDTEITGHPVVHLWLSASSTDADVFVYLEEVDETGFSTYLTEGRLRASHRALADAPYNTFGLPFQRSYAKDIAPLPAGEPVELVFDLLPTANVFDAGHRIRVTITGADAGNFATPQQAPPPALTLYRDAAHASYITLPVIPAD